MHQVRFVSAWDPTLVQYRLITCSYISCLERSGSQLCDSKSHVPNWRLVRLQPQNHRQVREIMHDTDEDIHTGIASAMIAEDILVGDNVACISEDPDDPFWFMLADKSCHVVAQTFTDDWKNTFEIGDVCIRGYWYERFRLGSRSYHLRFDKLATYILVQSILASKFSMLPMLHYVRGSLPTYELSEEALGQISDALQQQMLLDAC
jgi:hypothetical protein